MNQNITPARWINYSKTISNSACSIQKMMAILRRAVEPSLEPEEEREAEPEPYTPAQVAAGQTAGGIITHVGGIPVVPHRAPAVYSHTAYHPYSVPLVYYG